MPKKLLLVDGSNHAFRVHFALPPQHTSEGFPTRVLYGFTLLFRKLLSSYRPDYCAVSFDSGRSFRHELFPEYKGHRPDMPEDLARQWSSLPKLVEAFGYRSLHVSGFEADDVLGTLARRFASEEVEVYIVSSDKDFTQLLGPHTFLLDEGKGGRIYRAADVPEKLKIGEASLAVEQVLDLLALAGDASDNIPGVPGIGAKTAAKLLEQYGDLDAILAAAAAGRIKGKRGENLVAHADDARMSRELVTIRTDVPLPVELDDLAPRGFQEDDLRELFDSWEFVDVAAKLLPHRVAVDRSGYRVIADLQGLQWLLEQLRAAGRFAVSLRTSGPGPRAELLGIAFSTGELSAFVPLVPRGDLQLDVDEARALLLALLADPELEKIGADLKPQLRLCRRLGHDLTGIAGDVELLDYVLVAHRRSHGLAELARRYLGHTLAPRLASEPLVLEGLAVCCEPAHVAWLLEARLSERLQPETRWVYESLELPLIPVLAAMEDAGICLDLEVMQQIIDDIAGRVVAAEERCHEILGRPFKVGSPKELQEILFEELGLPPSRKIKTGYSTDASVLERLAEQHPLPRAILDWRSLVKLENTYLRPLPDAVAGDGRIHTTFNQAVAATGRLSSQDPNLQNIPVRTPEGKRIRDGFVAEAGGVLMSADYSQIELRLLAHFCGSGALVESFRAGEDIHRRTASEIFASPMEQVTSEQRTAAKAINFGLLYGMSAFRLGQDLNISNEEARRYMDDYFGRLPQVSAWLEGARESVREQGYAETLFGRRRLIPEIHSRDHTERMAAEREAVNTIVQGTAADLIKIAMIRVHAALQRERWGARLLLQVHDELLLEVPETEIPFVRALLIREMTGVADLAVPLEVQVGYGHNWNDAHG